MANCRAAACWHWLETSAARHIWDGSQGGVRQSCSIIHQKLANRASCMQAYTRTAKSSALTAATPAACFHVSCTPSSPCLMNATAVLERKLPNWFCWTGAAFGTLEWGSQARRQAGKECKFRMPSGQTTKLRCFMRVAAPVVTWPLRQHQQRAAYCGSNAGAVAHVASHFELEHINDVTLWPLRCIIWMHAEYAGAPRRVPCVSTTIRRIRMPQTCWHRCLALLSPPACLVSSQTPIPVILLLQNWVRLKRNPNSRPAAGGTHRQSKPSSALLLQCPGSGDRSPVSSTPVKVWEPAPDHVAGAPWRDLTHQRTPSRCCPQML